MLAKILSFLSFMLISFLDLGRLLGGSSADELGGSLDRSLNLSLVTRRSVEDVSEVVRR